MKERSQRQQRDNLLSIKRLGCQTSEEKAEPVYENKIFWIDAQQRIVNSGLFYKYHFCRSFFLDKQWTVILARKLIKKKLYH